MRHNLFQIFYSPLNNSRVDNTSFPTFLNNTFDGIVKFELGKHLIHDAEFVSAHTAEVLERGHNRLQGFVVNVETFV